MTADVLAADVLVWVVVHGLWLAAALAAVMAGAAAACRWQHTRPGGLRDQRAAVTGLCRRIADLDTDRAHTELELADARADVALARARSAALAGDALALQRHITELTDRLRLAELDDRTDWEAGPR